MNDKINIVFVTDNNYFDKMIVTIKSILENTQKDDLLNFIIMCDNVLDDKKEYLKSIFPNTNIVFEDISLKEFDNLKTRNHISVAAYKKILILNLSKKINKVIYLDCDIIVNCDISLLWNQIDNKTILKAVWNPFYNYDNNVLGLDLNCKTFNSGVLLFNFKNFDIELYMNKLKDFILKKSSQTLLHDQAAFNYAFHSKWAELDYTWNVQNCFFQNDKKNFNMSKKEIKKLRKNPKIIHFTGNSKPWELKSAHPYKNLYKHYYKKAFNKSIYYSFSFKNSLIFCKEKIKFLYYSLF